MHAHQIWSRFRDGNGVTSSTQPVLRSTSAISPSAVDAGIPAVAAASDVRGTVLLVANYAPDTGFAWWLMENFWLQFASVAREHGFKSLIVYPEEGAIPAHLLEAGVPTAFHEFPGSHLRAILSSLRLIREHRVRVVYFTDRAFSSFTYALLRIFGVRAIINHDHTPGDQPAVRGLRGVVKALWRRLPLVGCNLQICVSPLIGHRAIRTARIPVPKVLVVQNGITPFDCSPGSTYVRDTFGLPKDAPVCVTVGRADPYKRIDFVLHVARQALQTDRAAAPYFVYCGDGPDIERLQSLADQMELGGRFVFAGRRSDVKPILCSADMAIHAARGEAFSLAILEYMSAGLPVLVPDIPSVCQAIRARDTGRIFRDGDAADAAAQLLELCHSPDQRTRMGAAAAEEVRQRYSLQRMNENFREAANTVICSLSRVR